MYQLNWSKMTMTTKKTTHTSDESFIDHPGFTIDDKEVKLVVQEDNETKAEYKMSTEEFSKAYHKTHNR